MDANVAVITTFCLGVGLGGTAGTVLARRSRHQSSSGEPSAPGPTVDGDGPAPTSLANFTAPSDEGGADLPRPPVAWWILLNMLRRLAGRTFLARLPLDQRDTLILDAALAIRLGRHKEAGRLLDPYTRYMTCDPAFLNLSGVICENRQNWKLARRFYGAAISVDPHYPPAQQNMRRIYELYTFGASREPLSLGDDEIRMRRSCRGADASAERPLPIRDSLVNQKE